MVILWDMFKILNCLNEYDEEEYIDDNLEIFLQYGIITRIDKNQDTILYEDYLKDFDIKNILSIWFDIYECEYHINQELRDFIILEFHLDFEDNLKIKFKWIDNEILPISYKSF